MSWWQWIICKLFHRFCGTYCMVEAEELEEIVETLQPVVLPKALRFNWKRDYGPLWYPGTTAFWLNPQAGDLPAGRWPLPFIKTRPPEYEHELYCDLTKDDPREFVADPNRFARPMHLPSEPPFARPPHPAAHTRA